MVDKPALASVDSISLHDNSRSDFSFLMYLLLSLIEILLRFNFCSWAYFDGSANTGSYFQ